MNIFTYSSYKAFINDYLKRNKFKGIMTELAKACGCDRTYLSQVLNGKADLLPDHLIGLSEAIHLNPIESDFFMLLLLKDRATTARAHKFFEGKVKKMKEDNLELTQKIKSKNDADEIISENVKTIYYSNLYYPLIHTLTSIEALQTVDTLSKKLHLPETEVLQILLFLAENNLVLRSKEKFIHSGKNVYLPRESPQTASFHLHPRIEAVRRSHLKNEIHATNYFSVSENAVEELRQQIIHLIEEQRKTVLSSGSEVACVFCCDFFIL